MKKNFFVVMVLLLVFGGSTAFTVMPSTSSTEGAMFKYSLIGGIVSKYDAANGIAVVNVGRVKEGKNLIATDLQKNRRLFMLAKVSPYGKVVVSGFSVMDSNGKFVRLDDPFRTKGDGTFGCPIGWDLNVICYQHPVYKVQVCYTRCTPNEITIQLPAKGL